jgi:hypothetical protein
VKGDEVDSILHFLSKDSNNDKGGADGSGPMEYFSAIYASYFMIVLLDWRKLVYPTNYIFSRCLDKSKY